MFLNDSWLKCSVGKAISLETFNFHSKGSLHSCMQFTKVFIKRASAKRLMRETNSCSSVILLQRNPFLAL